MSHGRNSYPPDNEELRRQKTVARKTTRDESRTKLLNALAKQRAMAIAGGVYAADLPELNPNMSDADISRAQEILNSSMADHGLEIPGGDAPQPAKAKQATGTQTGGLKTGGTQTGEIQGAKAGASGSALDQVVLNQTPKEAPQGAPAMKPSEILAQKKAGKLTADQARAAVGAYGKDKAARQPATRIAPANSPERKAVAAAQAPDTPMLSAADQMTPQGQALLRQKYAPLIAAQDAVDRAAALPAGATMLAPNDPAMPRGPGVSNAMRTHQGTIAYAGKQSALDQIPNPQKPDAPIPGLNPAQVASVPTPQPAPGVIGNSFPAPTPAQQRIAASGPHPGAAIFPTGLSRLNSPSDIVSQLKADAGISDASRDFDMSAQMARRNAPVAPAAPSAPVPAAPAAPMPSPAPSISPALTSSPTTPGKKPKSALDEITGYSPGQASSPQSAQSTPTSTASSIAGVQDTLAHVNAAFAGAPTLPKPRKPDVLDTDAKLTMSGF